MTDENLALTKEIRKGRDRRRATGCFGAIVDGKIRFKSKQAVRNYELAMTECFESDRELMDLAFVRCQKDTRTYRRQRKTGEMMRRKEALCYKSHWLKERKEFDGDECLFFPSMVVHRPERVKYNFKSVAAARAMLLMTQGLPPSPSMNMATHICGHGHLSCVNPKHLAWGNAKTNARDRITHSDAEKFVFGMSDDQINQIKEDKRLCNVIAWEMNIPAYVVDGIRTGRLWKD